MPKVSGIDNRPIRQNNERFAMDRYGVDILTMEDMIPHKELSVQRLPLYARHPEYTGMAVSRIEGERVKAGTFWRVQYVFEGFISSLPEPYYEFNGSVAEEPIETNPNFEEFAGTAAAPLNDAVFIDIETGKITSSAERGVFREFSKGDKAGVQSYVASGGIWSKTFFTVNKVSALSDLGTIDSPDGSPPSSSGRNWLLWEFSFRRRGHIYENRLSWRLSGRKGWDTDIY